MRVASHDGTCPPCSGRSALPVRLVIAALCAAVQPACTRNHDPGVSGAPDSKTRPVKGVSPDRIRRSGWIRPKAVSQVLQRSSQKPTVGAPKGSTVKTLVYVEAIHEYDGAVAALLRWSGATSQKGQSATSEPAGASATLGKFSPG